VARALGAIHLDSGALYRALTLIALEQEDRSAAAILASAGARGLALRPGGGDLAPFLDNRDAEPRIRTPEVTALVSEVSAMPEIREWVNSRLRQAAVGSGILVLDGRDIGTAVFPSAPVKVFLTATPEARARRRLLQRGERADAEQVAREAAMLVERDRLDSSRAIAPLRKAEDAVVLDTTRQSFDEQVGAIVSLVRQRISTYTRP
jgi:cytidylate kinase